MRKAYGFSLILTRKPPSRDHATSGFQQPYRPSSADENPIFEAFSEDLAVFMVSASQDDGVADIETHLRRMAETVAPREWQYDPRVKVGDDARSWATDMVREVLMDAVGARVCVFR